MNDCAKDWIDITSALVTPFANTVIAFIVALIAHRQWVSMERTRRQQYSERYASNYEKVSEALGIVMREAAITPEAREKFWRARDEARLFLHPEVAQYTQTLQDKANELFILQKRLENEAVGPVRTKMCEEEGNLIEFFIDQEPYHYYRKHIADHG